MGIKRKIKLFFADYGKLLFQVIGGICILIYIIQSLNNYVIEQEKDKITNTTTEEQKEIIKLQKEEEKTEEEYISLFIDYCNERKIKEAYEMLSDKCKTERYANINIFKDEYIKNVFKLNISKYSIKKIDDTYSIILVEDELQSGKGDSTKEEIYIIEGILDRKIYIVK